jgi:hypothetical protein
MNIIRIESEIGPNWMLALLSAGYHTPDHCLFVNCTPDAALAALPNTIEGIGELPRQSVLLH